MALLPEDYQTPAEMQDWFRDEALVIAKGAQLRIQDALQFVRAYDQGKLTAEEANKRFENYRTRWGEEAIPGIAYVEGKSDEKILAEMDAQRQKRKEEGKWESTIQRDTREPSR